MPGRLTRLSKINVAGANGTPRPGVTGRDAALPLLFQLFDRLEYMEAAVLASVDNDQSEFDTGAALVRLAPQKSEQPPEIVFPENGVELLLSERALKDGYTLSARGGAGRYQWYVDGMPVEIPEGQNRPVWFPQQKGFYRVTVVDANGVKARSDISVQ